MLLGLVGCGKGNNQVLLLQSSLIYLYFCYSSIHIRAEYNDRTRKKGKRTI